jgi:hypothetical protein
MGVHLTRQLNERCGDLIWVLLLAEPSEPDAAVEVADGLRRHDQGYRTPGHTETAACWGGTISGAVGPAM